jgi:nitrogen fixation NifU-like protein
MLHEELMDIIMDHYENPRNYGKIEKPDIEFHGGNPGCGDTITLQLKISESGIVEDIKFEIEGCIVSSAGTSMISEKIINKPIEEIKKLGRDEMKELLGKDIIIRRPQCSNLGIDTFKAAIKKYEKEKLASEL